MHVFQPCKTDLDEQRESLNTGVVLPGMTASMVHLGSLLKFRVSSSESGSRAGGFQFRIGGFVLLCLCFRA